MTWTIIIIVALVLLGLRIALRTAAEDMRGLFGLRRRRKRDDGG